MSAPLTEQAAAITIEDACRTLRLPTVREQAAALAEAAVRDPPSLSRRSARRRARRSRGPPAGAADRRGAFRGPSAHPSSTSPGAVGQPGHPGRARDVRLDRGGRAGRPPRRQRHRQESPADRARHGRLRARPPGPLRDDGRVGQRTRRGGRRADAVAARRGMAGSICSASTRLAYVHLDPRGAELLFQVLTERDERASVVVPRTPVQRMGPDVHRPSPRGRRRRPPDVPAHILETIGWGQFWRSRWGQIGLSFPGIGRPRNRNGPGASAPGTRSPYPLRSRRRRRRAPPSSPGCP